MPLGRYRDRTVARLFVPCLATGLTQDSIGRAIAWVMAENDMAAWKVVCKWFQYMEQGEAEYKYPDAEFKPRNGVAITQETADRLIEEMEADFALEQSRWPEGRGPEFGRLPPHARLAFAQEMHIVTKSMAEIAAEAEARLKAGEEIPPKDAWTGGYAG